MKVNEAQRSEVLGKRIRCTAVAESAAEKAGFCDDSSRLLGQEGLVQNLLQSDAFGFSQLMVRWDKLQPGVLFLCGEDEFEVIE